MLWYFELWFYSFFALVFALCTGLFQIRSICSFSSKIFVPFACHLIRYISMIDKRFKVKKHNDQKKKRKKIHNFYALTYIRCVNRSKQIVFILIPFSLCLVLDLIFSTAEAWSSDILVGGTYNNKKKQRATMYRISLNEMEENKRYIVSWHDWHNVLF